MSANPHVSLRLLVSARVRIEEDIKHLCRERRKTSKRARLREFYTTRIRSLINDWRQIAMAEEWHIRDSCRGIGEQPLGRMDYGDVCAARAAQRREARL